MPSPDDLLAVTALAVGGEGVAREPSGRVVFVEGALPGERVRVAVTDERRHHARAVTLEVVEPAGARVTPPCPFVAAGCGGCGWQHVDPEAQRALKASMVAEALARLGGVQSPEVAPGPDLPATGYRTSLRGVADEAGRFALRRHHSHDLVPVPACLVAHPRLAEVAAEGRFPPGSEITIRVGAHTGDRMVIVDAPAAPAAEPPSDSSLATAADAAEVPGARPTTTEPGEVPGVPPTATAERVGAEAGEVGGRSGPEVSVAVGAEAGEVPGVPPTATAERVGAEAGEVGGRSGPEVSNAAGVEAGGVGGGPLVASGAERARVAGVEVPDGVRVVTGDELAGGRRAWLFEVVAGVRLRVSARSFFQAGPDAAEALVAAVKEALGPCETLADLYAGVGLFAATVGRGARVVAVEASASAAADARVNLAGGDAKVVRSDVARWRPRAVEAVVADPPRAGLGRGGVRAVAATRAARVALVSCDAGALGRDARLLAEAGYAWTGSTLVDAFPHTPHVEVVSRFERRVRVSGATGAGMPD